MLSLVKEQATDSSLSLSRTIVEYFAGIGLVRMGLEEVGWKVLYSNDWSQRKRTMYEAFFPGADHYVCDDIFEVDTKSIPLATLATCSFPCIDLSLAGNYNGIHGKHSSAFWGFVKVLQEQGDRAPSLVLVENVPGWLSSNRGADFKVTIKALNDLGYTCDVFTLNAIHFTPQSRRRIFVIGSRHDVPKFDSEILFQRSSFLAPDRLKEAILYNRELAWTSLNIPEPPPPLRSGLTAKVIERISQDDPRWWPRKEVERHVNMISAAQRERIDLLANHRTFSYRTFFRRRRDGAQRVEIRNDDISGCLRTAIGGSSRQFIIMAGRGQIRMRNMTSREYARLQGVPDSYPITVDENQALTGFGDAVCVPAISWIGRNALEQLIR